MEKNGQRFFQLVVIIVLAGAVRPRPLPHLVCPSSHSSFLSERAEPRGRETLFQPVSSITHAGACQDGFVRGRWDVSMQACVSLDVGVCKCAFQCVLI